MTSSLSKGPYENHYYALGEPIRNGELCIEIAQDTHRRFWVYYPRFTPNWASPRQLKDIQTLREYLYHKTPPGNPINPGETGEILNFTIEP